MSKQVERRLPKRDQKNDRLRPIGGDKGFAAQWWREPADKIGAALEQLIIRLDRNNQDARERFMRYARLYGNYEALGLDHGGGQRSYNRPVYNIIQSGVDTIASKIIRDNPKPYFITDGADYFTKLKAEKLTRFVQGCFEEQQFYQIANNKVFRDAAVYGLGGVAFRHNRHTNRIDADWMFIDELKVDRFDALKQKPRSLHRVRLMQKEVLLEMYPDDASRQIIEDATTGRPAYYQAQADTTVELLMFQESWHLSSGKQKGRYVATVASQALEDTVYDEDFFPFAFFRYYEKPIGFAGRGVPETILSAQIEINKILNTIQQCQELQARPTILIDSSSEVMEDAISSNRIARFITYRGGTNPPQWITPSGAAPETYEHLQTWMTLAREELGITQTAQAGQKQPGINSAVALRTMVDIESDRFIQVSKNWERFVVDAAEINVKLARRAYEKDPTFSVRYTDKLSKRLSTIGWKDVQLPDDQFTIRCDTISAFPSSAAGRIQTITDFIGNGFISQERGMDLLQLDPDIEGETRLRTSSLHLTEKALCEMVEEDRYSHPEKYMNLQLSLQVSVATYNQLKVDGCPDRQLGLVRNWIDEITQLLGAPDPITQMLQQTFAPAGAAPPVAPQQGLSPVAAAA